MMGSTPLAPTVQHETTGGDLRQVVYSPEQVALHLPVTGPTTRMLAYGIDCLAILALEALIVTILLLSTPLLERGAGMLQELLLEIDPAQPLALEQGSRAVILILTVFLLLQFTGELAYFVGCEVISNGRSIGKAVVGLRVVRDGGLPITVEASLVRNLLRIVDMLPGTYVVGLTSIVVSSQGKRLGDIAAGTIVVRLDRPLPAAEITADAAISAAAYRFEHAQIARLGPNERALLRQTLRRVATLEPARAEAVLDAAVAALRQRIDYGPVARDERTAFLRALLQASQRQ
jgi:uncharacterized RDD family membrane protein YckC